MMACFALYKQYGTIQNAYTLLWGKTDTLEWTDSLIRVYERGILEDANYMNLEYVVTSPALREYNASEDLLTEKIVSEFSKTDIYILRNSIFARHGYSFRKKDLRQYFDRQEWYIPVHANVRSDLTALEKQNIKLLLAYEEHAEEYYDSFGR